MDFLTQPLRPTIAPASPPATATPVVKDAPTTTRVDSDKIETDATSFFSTTSDAVSETGERFAQLRTSPAGGRESEQPLDMPSLRKGDWRAFSRVEARVVVWKDGHFMKGARQDKRIEQETVLTGTVWCSKNDELIFVVDTSTPPRSEPLSVGKQRRSSAFASISRRLSLSRPTSPAPVDDKAISTEPTISPSGDAEKEQKNDRRRSSIPAFLRRKSSTSDLTKATDDPVTFSATKDDETASEGIFAFVKGLFGGGTTADDDANGLSLTRTRTKAVEPSTTSNSKSRSNSRSRRKSEDAVAPRASPLPTYQNYAISALYIPSLQQSVLAIRFLPQRPSGSSSSASSPPLSRTVSREISGQGSLNVNFSSSLDLLPPRVEIDVAAKEGEKPQDEEGKSRDATVAFCFVEPLMAQEADEFRKQLEDRSGVKVLKG